MPKELSTVSANYYPELGTESFFQGMKNLDATCSDKLKQGFELTSTVYLLHPPGSENYICRDMVRDIPVDLATEQTEVPDTEPEDQDNKPYGDLDLYREQAEQYPDYWIAVKWFLKDLRKQGTTGAAEKTHRTFQIVADPAQKVGVIFTDLGFVYQFHRLGNKGINGSCFGRITYDPLSGLLKLVKPLTVTATELSTVLEGPDIKTQIIDHLLYRKPFTDPQVKRKMQ